MYIVAAQPSLHNNAIMQRITSEAFVDIIFAL